MLLITATLLHNFLISPNFLAFSLIMSSNPPCGARILGSVAGNLIIRASRQGQYSELTLFREYSSRMLSSSCREVNSFKFPDATSYSARN